MPVFVLVLLGTRRALARQLSTRRAITLIVYVCVCGLLRAEGRLQVAGWRLQVAGCRLQVARRTR
jgi:hypothetical protein